MIVINKYTFDDLLYSQKKLFVKFSSSDRKDDSLLVKYNIPAGGHINTDENVFYPHNVRLPAFGKGNYYARDYKSGFYATTQKGNILYAYGHNSEILEYDLKNKKTITHNIKSLIIDTIMPTSKPDQNLLNREGRYAHLYYNKYDHRYYRFFILPHNDEAPPTIKNKKRLGVIIADTSFNTIAEGILPKGIDCTHALFTKKGIWLKNTAKTSTHRDTLVYSLFTLNFKEVQKKNFFKIADIYDTTNIPVKTENPQAYIDKYLNPGTNNIGIILIPAVSCQSCANWSFSYFKDNIEQMKKLNIFLIPSGNESLLNIYMQQSGMTKEQENLKIDSSEVYLNYIDKFFNPQFIYSKNGKIIFDKIYSVSGLYELSADIKKVTE